MISLNGSYLPKSAVRAVALLVACTAFFFTLRSSAQVPQSDQLPFALPFPKRIDASSSLERNGWSFQGGVEMRKVSSTEEHPEIETDRGGYGMISAKFTRAAAMPDCIVSFKWKTNRPPKDVEVRARIVAPVGPGVLANGVEGRVPIYIAEKSVKAVPTKEWSTVEVPLELGKDGLTSVNQNFTVTLSIPTPKVKVLIDDLRILASPKR